MTPPAAATLFAAFVVAWAGAEDAADGEDAPVPVGEDPDEAVEPAAAEDEAAEAEEAEDIELAADEEDMILLTADEDAAEAAEETTEEAEEAADEEEEPEADELDWAATRTQISSVIFWTFKVSAAEQAAATQGVAALVMASLASPHWHA